MLLGVGAKKTSVFVDDVFSTYVYEGDGTTSHQIVNGIDLASKGGLIWGKERGNSGSHYQFDTVRGLNKRLKSNSNSAEETDTFYSSVNSNGYTINKTTSVNVDGNDYASWTFRKSPMFDVVQYSGNSVTNRQISHNLGSNVGMVMIKSLDSADGWAVWHRDLPNTTDWLALEENWEADKYPDTNGSLFGTSPARTSTYFTVGFSGRTNQNGQDYIAYVFAGGESTAATAKSVDFDGSDDQLNIPDSADWDLGNGDFTIETWIKSTQTTSGYFTALGQWTTHTSPDYGWAIRYASQDIGTGWSFFYSTNGSNYTTTMGSDISDGQWHHVAITRTGGKLRTFTDGILNTTRSTTDTFNTSGATMKIGGQGSSGNYFDGQLSNVRLVKGTAVYTSSFRPPTEPLTNITNTKLLCCNNSSTTGSTVTPGTITASSSPTASTDSPFDDPAGFVFGDAGDQNVIKCGSYQGTGAAGNEVFLGWEPQWLLVKNASSGSTGWAILDSMRGIITGDNEYEIYANSSNAETNSNGNRMSLTATGFILNDTASYFNSSGDTYIFLAIRRSDGYVGKPYGAGEGTSVFAMDTGNGSSTIPAFDSGFPVDFGFWKNPTVDESWYTSARLTQHRKLFTNTNVAESAESSAAFDSNTGFYTDISSSNQAFMWKRHAGFTVCTWEGDGVAGRQIAHDMNKTVEMLWLKNRSSSSHNWMCYHKGLNGGTNPEDYFLRLNTSDAEGSSSTYLNSTAPTSTHITLGSINAINASGNDFIAMLFASVDGISKVGSYTGNETSGLEITVGFQPRFVIIKNIDDTYGWLTFDTTRGWGSGNDKLLKLNSSSAEYTSTDYGAPTSTGFTVSSNASINQNGDKFIYYAHA